MRKLNISAMSRLVIQLLTKTLKSSFEKELQLYILFVIKHNSVMFEKISKIHFLFIYFTKISTDSDIKGDILNCPSLTCGCIPLVKKDQQFIEIFPTISRQIIKKNV